MGSETVAQVLQAHCVDYADEANGRSIVRKNPRGENRTVFPWASAVHGRCGGQPFGHNSLFMYKDDGVSAFEICGLYARPIRLYTVLRDPTEKFFSGLHFWRRLLPKSLLAKMGAPANWTASDTHEAAVHIFDVGRPKIYAQGPLLQYNFFLSKVTSKAKDSPTPDDSALACANLGERAPSALGTPPFCRGAHGIPGGKWGGGGVQGGTSRWA